MSRQDARPATSDAPSTPPPPDPSRPVGTPAARGFRASFGFAIERVPFRRKLNILVAIPVVVIAILFAVVVNSEVQSAESASNQADLFRSSEQVAQLVDDVQAEHQQANVLSARFDLFNMDSGKSDNERPSVAAFETATEVTREQTAAVRKVFGSSLPPAEAVALGQVDSLEQIRSQIAAGQLVANNIDNGYELAADGLVDGLGLDTNHSGNQLLSQQLDALLRTDSTHSAYETSLLSAQTSGSNAMIEFMAAVGYQDQYTEQKERFGRLSTTAQADTLGGIDYNSNEKFLDNQFSQLEVDPSPLTGMTTAAALRSAEHEVVEPTFAKVVKEAATRLAITRSLTDQIASNADDASDTAWWHAGLLAFLALLISATWVTMSVLIRHSVVRPVQRLTAAARKVATVSEAELSRVADDDSLDESPARLEALPVVARDELGLLAEAFNLVQITAAGLLERQVTSRRNIAEMFGNIGRRVSNLTTRQLALIDGVERSETDPDLLEQLYRIDHIAVRMQRNADSLMLLAGIRESELDGRPAAVTHVLRAALGQIEGYQRVVLHTRTDATVSPDIVGDLVLMLAELLENAVAFSPAHSNVEVTVRTAAGGPAVIEIMDHGLGMGSDRMAEENARLIRRERLDLVPTKVLGLFVVGTLARRWGVTVTLARTPGGGVTSLVTVPRELLAAPVAAQAPAAPEPPAALTVSATVGVPAYAYGEPAAPAGYPAPGAYPAPGGYPQAPAQPGYQAPAAQQGYPAGGGYGPPAAYPAPAAPAAQYAHEARQPYPAYPSTGAYPPPAAPAAGGGYPAAPSGYGAPAYGAPAAPAAHYPPPVHASPVHAAPAHAAPAETAPRSSGLGSAPVSIPLPPAVEGGLPRRAVRRAPDEAVHTHAAEPSRPPVQAQTWSPAPTAQAPVQAPAPAPVQAQAPAPARPQAASPSGTGRPEGLRRRVRGATLNQPNLPPRADVVPSAPLPEQDAEQVRSSLEEFEAAVDRAQRDSTLTGLPVHDFRSTEHTAPHDFPEGVGP